ncbi:unnamed protein product [Clonostachys solani]|uniref:Uncharacterized protein n=1 Tax=Clonostachys solani TaxID=160281 RepID=A0A9N9YZH5_9HYPO|nr:unnamed protein product [Clonostachys solani]
MQLCNFESQDSDDRLAREGAVWIVLDRELAAGSGSRNRTLSGRPAVPSLWVSDRVFNTARFIARANLMKGSLASMSWCAMFATTPSAGNASSTVIGAIGAPTTPLKMLKNTAETRSWCFGEKLILEMALEDWPG